MKIHPSIQYSPEGEGGGGGGTPPAPMVLDLNSLPEDLRKEASLSSIKTIPDLAKSYVNAQKLIGVDKIPKPQKTWKPEQFKEFYQALGRPENPEGYTYKPEKLPEGLQLDDAKLNSARKAMFDAGLTDSQAASVLKYYFDTTAGEFTEAGKQRENSMALAVDALKKEWGDKFDAKLNTAQAVVKKFGGDGAAEFLEKHGNDPTVVKMFAQIGSAMLDDTAEGAGGGLIVGDPAQAQAEIQQLKVDKDFMEALTTHGHIGHKAAVERWTALHEKGYPSK